MGWLDLIKSWITEINLWNLWNLCELEVCRCKGTVHFSSTRCSRMWHLGPIVYKDLGQKWCVSAVFLSEIWCVKQNGVPLRTTWLSNPLKHICPSIAYNNKDLWWGCPAAALLRLSLKTLSLRRKPPNWSIRERGLKVHAARRGLFSLIRLQGAWRCPGEG